MADPIGYNPNDTTLQQPLSISTPGETDGTLSLKTDKPVVTYPDNYTDTKAGRYNVVLNPGDNPGIDLIRNDVAQGNSNQWDQILAANINIQNQQLRSNIVGNIAQNLQGRLPTPDEQNLVLGLTDDQLHASDVNTILSKKFSDYYANQVVSNTALTFGQGKTADQVIQNTDDIALSTQRNLLAQDEYGALSKRLESVNVFDKGYAFAKRMIPFYDNIFLRDAAANNPTSAVTGDTWLPGSTMQEKVANLYTLSAPEFQTALHGMIYDLEQNNPLLARDFAQAVLSYGTADKVGANIQVASDATIFAGPLLKAAGAVTEGIKGVAAGFDYAKGYTGAARAAEGAEGVAAAGRASEAPAQVGNTRLLTGSDARVPGTVLTDQSRVPSMPSPGTPITGGGLPKATGPYGQFIPQSGGAAYRPNFTLTSDEIVNSKIASAAVNPPTDVSKIAGEAGVNDVAGRAELISDMQTGDPTGLTSLGVADPVDVERRLPAMFSPGRMFSGVSDSASTARNRGMGAILRTTDTGILESALRVDRLTPEQFQQGVQDIWDRVPEMFPATNHNVVEMTKYAAEKDPYTNLYYAGVKFGQRDGTWFTSPKAAENFVKRNISERTDDYQITQEGAGGWSVEWRTPVDETGDLRKVQIPTQYKTPDRFLQKAGGQRWQSPDYTLPIQNVNRRGRVVASVERMEQALKQWTEPFTSLPGDQRDKLEALLVSNRNNRTFLTNPTDATLSYLQRHNEMPTNQQLAAYEAYTRWYDLDYTSRNFDLLTQMQRQGIERFSFKQTGHNSGEITNKEFNGKIVDNIPYNSKDKFFVQSTTNNVQGPVYSSDFLKTGPSESTRNTFKQLIDQGYKVVLEPETSTYHVVQVFKRSQPYVDQLPYNPGGHNINAYGDYIKSPILEDFRGVTRYSGDMALGLATSPAHAKEITRLLETGRGMINRNDPQAAKFWNDSLSDFMPYNQYLDLRQTGRLKPDAPFIHVNSGQQTVSAGNWAQSIPNFFDATDSEHNILRNISGSFLGEQTNVPLKVLQAESNKIIDTVRSPYIAPYDALVTSMSDVLDLSVINDYRQASAADFFQEFGHLMDINPNRLYNNPLYYLKNPVYRSDANAISKRLAENVRLATLQLNDHEAAGERLWRSFQNALISKADDLYGVPGRELMTDRMLPAINTAPAFLKGIAFNAKLGLFNVAQTLVQMSEITKIVAINPVQGTEAIKYFLPSMIQLMTDNPKVLQQMSHYFGKVMTFDAKNFHNMVEAFKESGFSIIGRDQAYLENVNLTAGKQSNNGLIRAAGTASTAVLTAGRKPFEAGELAARTHAWNTSWLEWQARNPGKEIDRFALTQILQRAKNMTNSMGRDSQAAWQKQPILGTLTNFWGYNARLTGSLWENNLIGDGRKFTLAEKARIITMYGALFGVGASAAAVTGYNFHDQYLSYMAQSGKPVDPNTSSVLVDGAVTYAFHAMLGEKYDMQALAPNGFPALYQLINDGDKGIFNILGGVATNSSLKLFLDTLGGTANLVSDAMNLNTNEGRFKMLSHDLLSIANNVNTVDRARVLYQVVNTQMWVNKNDKLLANDATLQEGLMNLLGLPTDRIQAAYTNLQATGKVKEFQMQAVSDAAVQIANAQRAANGDNPEAAQEFYKRARQIMISNGLTSEQINQAYTRGWSTTPFTEQSDQIYRKWYDRNRQQLQN